MAADQTGSPKAGSIVDAFRQLLAVTCLCFVAPALAADDIDREVRRVESALTRVSREQQSVYQQFQMVQQLRRGEEERQVEALQSTTPLAAPPNYDDVKREEEARARRIKEYRDELDRLYARYRELEKQKTSLLEELSVLEQRRSEEP